MVYNLCQGRRKENIPPHFPARFGTLSKGYKEFRHFPPALRHIAHNGADGTTIRPVKPRRVPPRTAE